MFGLAVIAVAALMAFVGASSAMATPLEEVVVCKENVSPCPTGKSLGSGTVLHGELEAGTKALLLANPEILCESSTTLGTLTSPTSLAHGEITALTFGTCHTGGPTPVNCTVTVQHLNYLVKGELKSSDTGYEVLVTELGTNGKPQAKVVCGTLVECEYGAPNVLLEAEAKAGDTVLSVLQELEGKGPLCGTIAKPIWHAKYLTRCLEGGNLVGCWLTME